MIYDLAVKVKERGKIVPYRPKVYMDVYISSCIFRMAKQWSVLAYVAHLVFLRDFTSKGMWDGDKSPFLVKPNV